MTSEMAPQSPLPLSSSIESQQQQQQPQQQHDSPGISRPQVGINRLPGNRVANQETKEVMNCKSCRKRKIKCNRVTPSCEACVVFNCACVYDAIPKKRGPKTDVLEALLERVDGLERRLKDDKPGASSKGKSGGSKIAQQNKTGIQQSHGAETVSRPVRSGARQIVSTGSPGANESTSLTRSIESDHIAPSSLATISVDAYFARVHQKPYYILDERATRQRLLNGTLPPFVLAAISAVTARFVPQLYAEQLDAITFASDCAQQARAGIDTDLPKIENLQTLLLLALAAIQTGRGQSSLIHLSQAVAMAFALGLHRELPVDVPIPAPEREGRRQLFWTCYLMDRFASAGSRRPMLILDSTIKLRLPTWDTPDVQPEVEGSLFVPHMSAEKGFTNPLQGSLAALIDVARILGLTNHYLAIGTSDNDSKFPWHAQSALSRIKAELDRWASLTQSFYTNIESIFGREETVILFLGKLIHHLIYCLVYRPFLPIDAAQLPSQPWHNEVVNTCFLHANAITELVELAHVGNSMDWPDFVGYCVYTAGTVHVHGAHYASTHGGELYGSSVDYLVRDFTRVEDISQVWVSVQHQRNMLSAIYTHHAEMVKSHGADATQSSQLLQTANFFDRYPGLDNDHASMAIIDVPVNPMEVIRSHTTSEAAVAAGYQPSTLDFAYHGTETIHETHRQPQPRPVKRRRTATGAEMPTAVYMDEIPIHDSIERTRSQETGNIYQRRFANARTMSNNSLPTQREMSAALSIDTNFATSALHVPVYTFARQSRPTMRSSHSPEMRSAWTVGDPHVHDINDVASTTSSVVQSTTLSEDYDVPADLNESATVYAHAHGHIQGHAHSQDVVHISAMAGEHDPFSGLLDHVEYGQVVDLAEDVHDLSSREPS